VIRTREQLRADADADVAAFAELIAGQEESTGIPKPPKIEVSEVALKTVPFNFGIIEEPETEVFPGPAQPPETCASSVSILVSGVTIRTDCIPADFCNPGDLGVQFNDVAMNGSLSPNNVDLTGWCPDSSTPAGCIWDTVKLASYHYQVCDGVPFNESDEPIEWTVANMDGTWYVIGVAFFNVPRRGIAFYAEALNTTSPLVNTLVGYSASCRDTPLPSSRFLDVWFGDCSPGSGDFLWSVIAIGGSVTIS
jgi:hypothetical protein